MRCASLQLASVAAAPERGFLSQAAAVVMPVRVTVDRAQLARAAAAVLERLPERLVRKRGQARASAPPTPKQMVRAPAAQLLTTRPACRSPGRNP